MAQDRVQPPKIPHVDGRPKTLHRRKAHLLLRPGEPDEQELSFDQADISIGSLDDNDVVITDETVGRHHCRIVREDEGWVVADLESPTGTYIDGVRVREAFLGPGQVLRVGQTPIRFSLLDEPPPLVPGDAEHLGELVGGSPQMREIFEVLARIAPTSATVVVAGETGTGKEVVARTIHRMSERSTRPFIVFDCGSVAGNLIESELFGHEKGSFTGAVVARQGLFEVARGGTIFLDEIGELATELQPRLLRVIEQREVRRIGSNRAIPIDVRIIAATNRDLEAEIAAGRFREDLYYRLSVVRVDMPPLRERLEEIPLLVDHFLEVMDFNRDDSGEQRITAYTPAVLEALLHYDWPGNVRELINVVERACSFSVGSLLTRADLPDHLVDSRAGRASSALGAGHEHLTPSPDKSRLVELPFKRAKAEWISSFERDYVLDLLARHDGNISQAAREADIDRKYFRKLMQKHGVDADEI